MSEVAEIVIDECGYLEGVPENVARYFDYEAFCRDLEIKGCFIDSDSGIIELIR
jgi:antirestriction protein